MPHWDFVYQIGMATAHNDHEMRRRHFKPTTLYCLTQTVKSGGLNSPGRHRSFSCCITRTGHFVNLSPPTLAQSLGTTQSQSTRYTMHGYQVGIGEVFRWVSVGYRWVSRVSPPGGWSAATNAVKLCDYENT